MTQNREAIDRKRLPLFLRVVGLALAINVLAWIGAASGPKAQAIWPWVSLVGFFLLGVFIGRPWALLVTIAFAVLHAIPVYLRLLPGHLSTWEESLWWIFATVILLVLNGFGVIAREVFRRLQRQ